MQNFPQYCIVQQRKNTDGKRKNKKVVQNQPKLLLLWFFFFLFVFQATSDALGTKTFRGLLHDIRMSFVQERVHTGCHTITSVQFIRNESFLSEFIGVFITERNTHSGQPFLPVQCKRGTALIFV